MKKEAKKAKEAKKKSPIKKIILFGLLALAVVITAYFLISGYVDGLPNIRYDGYTGEAAAAQYPDSSFAVISDIHFYDKSLGTGGAAFEEVLYSDRKLLLDSEDLLDYTIEELLGSDIQFVLVSGDLTKDGERINHDKVAAKLQQLVDGGIKVFVVPGNHDVNNPYGAVSFSGDEMTPVAYISAEDFAAIYKNMGYGDALMRDEHSLSYVAEPVDGLWILGIDACRYRENQPDEEEIVGGRITQESAEWMADVLGQAVDRNKAVIVLIHQGLMEHWDGQAKLHPDYIVEDFKYFGEFLASYNVRLGFTGHYHAQDVTRAEFDIKGTKKALHDIETGSLITAPCPIRYCSISKNTLNIRTNSIVDKLHPGTDFAENALSFVKETVYREAYSTLKNYKVSDDDADYIADLVGEAFAVHYSGDEDASLRVAADTSKLSLWGRVVYSTQVYVLDGLWNDLAPADNNVVIDLAA